MKFLTVWSPRRDGYTTRPIGATAARGDMLTPSRTRGLAVSLKRPSQSLRRQGLEIVRSSVLLVFRGTLLDLMVGEFTGVTIAILIGPPQSRDQFHTSLLKPEPER
jgi:hypothetical protein